MTEQITQAQTAAKTAIKQTRVNDILLGPLERPALKWLSEHTPSWISSDMMTGLVSFEP